MEHTFTLGIYIGFAMIILGAFFVLKYDDAKKIARSIRKRDGVLYALAGFEFLAGLLIVLLHNVWAFDSRVLVTVIGWGAMIEGIIYLLLPIDYLKREIRYLNRTNVYTIGGAFLMLFGLFVFGTGLGFF